MDVYMYLYTHTYLFVFCLFGLRQGLFSSPFNLEISSQEEADTGIVRDFKATCFPSAQSLSLYNLASIFQFVSWLQDGHRCTSHDIEVLVRWRIDARVCFR